MASNTRHGGPGDDTLYGGDGDQTLYGSRGDDTLYGGDGDDTLDGSWDNDTLYGGDGDDTLDGGWGDDFLYGDDGVDSLYGSHGNDELYGGEGGDTLEGGYGNDELYGGIGGDTLDGSWGNDKLYGDTGGDKLYGGRNDDELYGGSGDDNLYGGWGNDKLYGGAGNDVLSTDRLKSESGGSELYGGDGTDTLTGGIGDDTLDGGSGNDALTGGAGDDILEGGIGDDVLKGDHDAPGGYTGNLQPGDQVPGGTVTQVGTLSSNHPPGTDTFVFATRDFGRDTIVDFEVGKDKVDFRGSGLAASDLTFSWDAGTLTIDAGGGNSLRLQNLGDTQPDRDDVLATFLFDPPVPPVVSIGDATVTEGGELRFTVSLDKIWDRDVTVTWSTADGTATDGSDYTGQSGTLTIAAGRTSATITVPTADDAEDEPDETLTVTLGNPVDATLGDATGEAVIADDDDPPVVEPPVSQAVPANAESEQERLPLGADDTSSQPNGESGDGSHAAVAGTMAADVMVGETGADAINARGGDDTVRGRGGDDRLWGGMGDDTLHGNAGDDHLYGGRGKDVLYGGFDNDRLYGGKGGDTLYGGNNGDHLEGGRGDDVLFGGAGRDKFVYGDDDFGRDRIGDFKDGVDLLDLRGSGWQWSDLTVSSNGRGHAVVRIEGGDGRIVLEGVDASLIDQNDFIF